MSGLDRFRTGGGLRGALAGQLLAQTDHDSAPALASGARVGVWQIVSLLGRGGMAEVYLASRADADFQQTVAIKVVSGSALGRGERLQEERRLLARLKHPGIAALIDGGELEDGRAWFAMEHVEGSDLLRHVREQQRDWRAVLSLFVDLCAAVMHAHTHLLVHRDIKPANILVDHGGRLRLLDFGIAIRASDTDQGRDGLMTPGFAAPEQRRGGEITTATDIFQIGETLRAVSAVTPIPALLRTDLAAVIQKATRDDPTHRHSTVAELKRDLVSMLEFKPVAARRTGPWHRGLLMLRRHPRTTAIVSLLGLGLLASGWQLGASRLREAEERAAAAREAQTAATVGHFFLELFNEPTSSDGGVGELLDRGEQRLLASQRETAESRAPLVQALARANIQMERPDAARPLLEAAIADQKKLGAAASNDLALSIATLARLEFLSGDSIAAATLAQQARETLAASTAPSSLSRFHALAQLGEYHLDSLRFADAEVELAEALTLGKARYGADSPQLFRVRQMQLDVHRYRWEVDRGLPATRQLLADCLRYFGPNDANCITETANLGRQLSLSGELAEGESILRQLLRDADRWHGRQREQRTHSALFDLSENLWLQGRYQEARAAIEQSFIHLEKAFGAGGPHWDSDQGALALMLLDMDDATSALAVSSARKAGASEIMEDHFWTVRQSTIEVAAAQIDPTREPALARAVDVMRATYGANGYFTARAEVAHAELLVALGRLPEARKLLNQARQASPQGLILLEARQRADIARIEAGIARATGQPDDGFTAAALSALSAFPAKHPLPASWRIADQLRAREATDRESLVADIAVLESTLVANAPLLLQARQLLSSSATASADTPVRETLPESP